VPFVHATGRRTISVMSSAMPRISLVRASSCSAAAPLIDALRDA